LSGTRRSSETSGTTQRTTRRHIPEEDTLQNHRCENLKSYMFNLFTKYENIDYRSQMKLMLSGEMLQDGEFDEYII
jgi:hypothetical protein